MDLNVMSQKPHAVCIPGPAQGHINPMMNLAKLLHHKGFHITFVNTEFNHRRLLKSRPQDSLIGLRFPSFRFETIPDGLPPSDTDADATQDIPSLCDSTTKHCLAPFTNLLLKLNSGSFSGVPPVTCIVSDSLMSFTVEAAEQLGIPIFLFWTASACGFLACANYCHLIEKGFTPLKDASYLTNGYLETIIDWIPGMKGIALKDIPSFIRTTDPNDIMLNFVVTQTERNKRASAIILNTFDELEHDVLKALSSIFPPIYSIGPLNLLLNQFNNEDLKLIGSNLWKEDIECLDWLDLKEANSVVYVNFGSITTMTPCQLIEFAWGLANSNQTFFWVIRPDLISGESAVLPPEFFEVTKDRGMVAGWCPQQEVLGHSSIGGFLTHSGWNSTIESISFGVPMICWPFFADQQTNCWYCCTHWGIGMEIDNNVNRNEIERLVKELMVGEKGKDMKKKILEWKYKAEEATAASSGSSYLNMEKMINQVLLSLKQVD